MFHVFKKNVKNNQNLIPNSVIQYVLNFMEDNEGQEIIVREFNRCLSLVPKINLDEFDRAMKLFISKDSNANNQMKYEIIEENLESLIDADEKELSESEDIYIEAIEEVFDEEDTENQLDEIIDDRNIKENEQSIAINKVRKVRSSYTPKGERHICKTCGYQFANQSYFIAHENGHKLYNVVAKITDFQTCEECNFMFCDEESLRRHQELNHELIGKIGSFLKPGRFRSELVVRENDQEMSAVKCGHCDKGFQSEEDCRCHQYIFHVTNLYCPIENREFNNNQAFAIHMKNNHPEIFDDETIYKCKICNAGFENLYEKLRHMKNCDMKKIQCPHCDKKFSQKCYLNAHLREVKGDSTIVCKVCGKICKNKGDYNIHARTHTNEKPFKCSLCSKAYKTSSARASHLETHNVNGYPCDLCGQKFKARRILQTHIKLKHQ
jgi:hypothetical protein